MLLFYTVALAAVYALDEVNLVKGPLAFDTTTYLAYPIHFSKSYPFTISVWVWLYKQRYPIGRDIHIFSTRAAIDDINDIICPSILFSHGNSLSSFFFSMERDERGGPLGFYLGPEVRFHEWIHLTITYSDGTLNAFINGGHMGARLIKTSTVNQWPPEGSSQRYINNAILQAGGHRRDDSLVGMLSSLTVHQGVAFNQQDILGLMTLTTPSRLPTLERLLKAEGKFGLGGLCPRSWQGNVFLQREWGLCPESICGPFCLDEGFFLHTRSQLTKGAEETYLVPSWAGKRVNNRLLLPSPPKPSKPSLFDFLVEDFLDDDFSYETMLQNENLTHSMNLRNATKQMAAAEALYDAAIILLNGRHQSHLHRDHNVTLQGTSSSLS